MRHFIHVLVALVFTATATTVAAESVIGEARFYDPTGGIIAVYPSITGDLDVVGGTLSLSSVIFFGFQFNVVSAEVAGEGIHTRNDPASGTPITATVGPDQLGAFIAIEWGPSMFSTWLVWDVNDHAGGTAYTTVDSDGDGIPGHAFVVGPFPGFSVVYDLEVGEPPPGIEVSVAVVGGTVQECEESGGRAVTFTAAVELTGPAELSTIDWSVDGQGAGSGGSLTTLLPLGDHTVEVTAVTTTGESDRATVNVIIRDTTPPELDVAFVDWGSGEPIDAKGHGKVQIRYFAADLCDPDPTTSAVAVPVFAVADGDTFKIEGEPTSVQMPTTAVEVMATATDGSGNVTSRQATLMISE